MRFDDFELDYDILDAVEQMGYGDMTPVQEQTMPVLLRGDDLVGCAQTGTGKTAAFSLPLLDMLHKGKASGKYSEDKIKAVIMCPTRELATQIDGQIQGFSYYTDISTSVIFGGGDGKAWAAQRHSLESGVDIVVATPGRLLAHLESGFVDLSGVKHFVLDEADRMLQMGFYEDIMKVVSYLPLKRQTVLFSATLPPKIRKMADQLLYNPTEVIISASKPNESIDQSAFVLYETQKLPLIQKLFDVDDVEKTLIFSSSRLKVKELVFEFKKMKLNAVGMHSDLDQAQREEVMLDFKSGKIDILVATDIVARGIDIDDIVTVVNYDVPNDAEDYIHRIGRTGRASASGQAITFVNERDQARFKRIEDFLEREVRKRDLPTDLGAAPQYNPMMSSPEGFHRGGKGPKSGNFRNNKSRY
ncbi:MAG: DEAD/DEAH box helicase [Rikenellaceae bacterium]